VKSDSVPDVPKHYGLDCERPALRSRCSGRVMQDPSLTRRVGIGFSETVLGIVFAVDFGVRYSGKTSPKNRSQLPWKTSAISVWLKPRCAMMPTML